MQLRLIALAVGLAALVAAAWHGGARQVRGEWAEADLARERGAATLHAQEVRRQAAEAEAAEATRSHIQTQLREVTHDLQSALRQPIACEQVDQTPLADLAIPARVLDGLRRAGADQPSD